MSRLVIEGGKPLQGSLEISGGAKNSALAIIVAAALAAEGGESILENIPRGGSDITTVCEILQELGGRRLLLIKAIVYILMGRGGYINPGPHMTWCVKCGLPFTVRACCWPVWAGQKYLCPGGLRDRFAAGGFSH